MEIWSQSYKKHLLTPGGIFYIWVFKSFSHALAITLPEVLFNFHLRKNKMHQNAFRWYGLHYSVLHTNFHLLLIMSKMFILVMLQGDLASYNPDEVGWLVTLVANQKYLPHCKCTLIFFSYCSSLLFYF